MKWYGKAQATEAKCLCIKSREKSQAKELEKIFANHISSKGLIPYIILTTQQQNNPIENGPWNRHFTKDDIQAYEITFSIINY